MVDGDNKWGGYYFGDYVEYNSIKIIKNGQHVNFKLEDDKFKEGLVSDGSLSVSLTIYALMEARIEITDEIKVKDFVILEVLNNSKELEESLKLHSKCDMELFEFAGVDLPL